MSKRGGFSGYPGNMNNMLKQAQRLQRQMEEREKALRESLFTGTAGGGAVSVTVTGMKEAKKVTIDPEVLDPEDVETLEELIVMAFSDAYSQVEAASGETGGAAGMAGLF